MRNPLGWMQNSSGVSQLDGLPVDAGEGLAATRAHLEPLGGELVEERVVPGPRASPARARVTTSAACSPFLAFTAKTPSLPESIVLRCANSTEGLHTYGLFDTWTTKASSISTPSGVVN